MSSGGSGSERSPSRERSRSKGRIQKNKLFITNLDGTAKEEELQTELEQLFGKYGAVKELSVKKSKNGEYSFAFVTYQPGEDAEEAIKNLNNFMVKGKPMKVELQDDGKRRKDPDKGCYTCGKKGHFARECRSRNNYSSGYRGRRSRSRSGSDDRGKRRRHRSETPSTEKRRHKKDKDRKHSSKDKKKKKHKKSRHRSSSDSDS